MISEIFNQGEKVVKEKEKEEGATSEKKKTKEEKSGDRVQSQNVSKSAKPY
jgi:hypothetical protein